MRRLLAVPAIVALLVLSIALPASAAVQRDSWNTTYSLTGAQFCGFDVDVHDYGRNVYFQVSADGWTWAKQWHGTRDYTNRATSTTASLLWDWKTTQAVESRDATSITLLITSYGSTRVQSMSGTVVASQDGQITFRRVLVASGADWVQITPDQAVSWNGPHDLDLGTAFCDAMTGLLDPGG